MRSTFSKKTPIWRVENCTFKQIEVKLEKLCLCSQKIEECRMDVGCFFMFFLDVFEVPIWGMWNHRAHLVGSKDLLAWAVFSCRLVSTSHLLQILQDYTMERMVNCFLVLICFDAVVDWSTDLGGCGSELLEKLPGSTFGTILKHWKLWNHQGAHLVEIKNEEQQEFLRWVYNVNVDWTLQLIHPNPRIRLSVCHQKTPSNTLSTG